MLVLHCDAFKRLVFFFSLKIHVFRVVDFLCLVPEDTMSQKNLSGTC